MNHQDPFAGGAARAASVADALSKAVEHSRRSLFPINGERWASLAFIVFVATVGEGGGLSQLQLWANLPGLGSSRGGAGPELGSGLASALRYLQEHVALVLGVGSLLLTLSAGFMLLVLWWSSRMRLMLVESVVWGNVELGPQWARSAALGLDLWKFRVKLALGALFVWIFALGVGYALGWRDFQTGTFSGPSAITSYVAAAGAAVVLGLPVALTATLLDDFVVPIMVVRNLRTRDAFRAVRAEVLSNNVGVLCVFYLVRMVVGGTIGFLLQVLACVTCCLTSLPYVGTLVALPIHVFSRAFSLYFLEELGVPIFPRRDPAWLAERRWRFPG